MCSPSELKFHNSNEPLDCAEEGVVSTTVIARVLSFLRITPNVVTTLGLFSAIAIYFTSYTSQLLFLVIFSLICDGVDGSLAIYRNRASRGGELYDAAADRISEASWLMGATFVWLS